MSRQYRENEDWSVTDLNDSDNLCAEDVRIFMEITGKPLTVKIVGASRAEKMNIPGTGRKEDRSVLFVQFSSQAIAALPALAKRKKAVLSKNKGLVIAGVLGTDKPRRWAEAGMFALLGHDPAVKFQGKVTGGWVPIPEMAPAEVARRKQQQSQQRPEPPRDESPTAGQQRYSNAEDIPSVSPGDDNWDDVGPPPLTDEEAAPYGGAA